MFRSIKQRIFPDPARSDWQAWRETILAHSLLLGSVLICIALLPSVLLLAYEKKFFLLWLSLAAFVTFMGIFLLKRLPYSLKAHTVCFLLFCMGPLVMGFRGPFTSGLLWLFLAAVGAIVLINRRAAMWICLANLVVITAIGYGIAEGPPSRWNLLTCAPLINWGITGIIFMSIQFIVVLSLDFLLRSAEQAFIREQRLSASVAEEIQSHAKTNAALQKSEAHFRQLVEAPHLAIALVDKAGTFTYVNPGFTAIFGYTLDEVPTVTALLEKGTRDKESCEKAAAQWARDIEGLRPGLSLERMISLTSKTGAPKDVRIRPVIMDALQYLVTFEDRTRQISLENRIRQSQKMEALGTLTGGIAHDFNNILNIIIGYCDLALLEAPEPDETMENIRQAGVRASDIVRQLLTFIQKTNPEKTPVDLGVILERNKKMLTASLPPGIEFITQIPEARPWVNGDPSQLDQVIINLFTNAAQSFKERGGTILASLEPDTKADPPQIRLVMADTGEGISPEHLDRIFDPYFTTQTQGKGSGLGLSVVLGIVESHGGTVTVVSEPGEGTQVTVSFPATSESLDESAMPPDASLPKGDETIMVVDDEPRIIDVTTRYLSWLGYQVLSFTNPAEAFKAYRRDPENIALVITDLGMPEMKGDELSTAMLNINPNLPIVLCTGFNETFSATKARAMGISLFMEKPVTLSRLGSAIRDLLDNA